MESVESLSLELATRKPYLVWIETVLLAVINVASFFGNLSVCYAVYRNQRLRTLSNMFVVALAVSDILMSTCCMPFSVATLFHGKWIFGETSCRFHGFGVLTFGLASLLTMGIIAVSRYFCVVKPDKYIVLFKKKRTLIYIAVVWCTAFIGSVPPFLFKHGHGRLEFQPGKALCLYPFDTNIAYTIFLECVYIGTPLTVITICYAKVFYTVSRSNRVFSQENNPQLLRANVEEAKVTKTLAAVMVGFACCWIPVTIIDYIDAARGEPTLARQAYLTYGFLIYLSSTINPFIYGATNKNFRREYHVILSNILCLRSSRRSVDSEVVSGRDSRRNRGEAQRGSPSAYQWLRLNFRPDIATNSINTLAEASQAEFPETHRQALEVPFQDDIGGSRVTSAEAMAVADNN
ncbi:Melatonin- receptor [Desmophyllum pertusum]|uniref:Melatonin- receptor n=1 Tax=Desmophyllum pertusum TaxID=174260 RepID=A0A9X0CM34_9CNID|nr:Melatonin- receptor [Desmophyllum pertusum]